ncbi:L-asparaginase-like isoform X3 [Dermacentor andersoni]|uniref:L-asparaginase-like isoform X3 n=1 Tax=Dermacentor andersoni TaxID=34620 RepID=UPI002415CB30|nr:L-asparaginase-like isoform X3 [Dermacentor andersoni]
MAEGSTTDTSYAPKVLRSLTGDRDAWHSCTGPDQACVLVIYTGGTIGMVKDEKGLLKPAPGILDKRLREFPQLHDEEYMRSQFGDCKNCPLVLPSTGDPRRVVYTISEYSVLIDSSNITVNDWTKIAIDIKDNYDLYDGFVILHGTDTMAYTSSALSFLLESLGKSVILTGAQIPVFETRSDGRDNLLNALILAGNYVIPEVEAFFGTPMKGVVLQTYGAGNVPTKRKDIMHAIRRATERGVLIVSCSQCLNGAVDPAYETGRELLNVGAIPGADMTPEAALTKLSFVISKTEWTDKKKREKLKESLRGELTTGSERGFNVQYNVANISPWKRLLIH